VAIFYFVNASSISTCKLFVTARLRSCTVMQSGIFICAIHTIRISIAKPFSWYALRSTPILVCLACKFCLFVAFSIICRSLVLDDFSAYLLIYVCTYYTHVCYLHRYYPNSRYLRHKCKFVEHSFHYHM
jgi:hypothetical protein